MTEDTDLYLQDCRITGARGRSLPRGCGTDGSAALRALGTSSVELAGSQLIGGAPGLSLPPLCTNPTAVTGPASILEPPATLVDLSVQPLRLQATAVAREGQPVDYSITGQPGDLLALAFSVNANALAFPPLRAPLLVGPTFVGIPIGSIPSNGSLTLATTAPTYPPGIDVERYFIQAIAIRANALIGGGAQAVTLLDAAF